jgi:hypothetical protein
MQYVVWLLPAIEPLSASPWNEIDDERFNRPVLRKKRSPREEASFTNLYDSIVDIPVP